MINSKKDKEIWFFQVLKFILVRYKSFPFWAILSIVGRVASIILSLLPAIYYSDMINIISQSQAVRYPIAQHAIGILIVVFAIKFFNNSLVYRIYEYALIKLEMSMQQTLYDELFLHLHKHSYQYFIDHFSGKLVAQIRKMIWALERFTDLLIGNILSFFLNVFLVVIIVAHESWMLGLGMFIFVACFSCVQYWVARWLQSYPEKANKLDSDLGGVLSDTIGNALTVKTFAALQREAQNFAQLNAEATKARTKQYLAFNLMGIVLLVMLVFLEIATLWYAVILWWAGGLELGMIVLVQTYTLRIIDQVMSMGFVFRSFSRIVAEIGEGLEIIQTPREIKDVENAPSLRINEAKIRFQNVDFSYQDEQLFHGLDFEIKPGEHVALVWASGSGKSTITKLLFRFYDIQKGKILIDDQDISQVTQESLRTHLSLVPQDPILFHRSIRENIAYARPDASDDEIKAAAKMARCDLFIDHLEDKYETLVGERGIKLSWGERQRIAIARAIIENAPILIMDEATSALDSESEKYIQEAMVEVMKNKTSIVIAHRLSTIMKMDRIIVMDQWKIVESWTHSELIQKPDGIYKKLRDIQSGGFIK